MFNFWGLSNFWSLTRLIIANKHICSNKCTPVLTGCDRASSELSNGISNWKSDHFWQRYRHFVKKSTNPTIFGRDRGIFVKKSNNFHIMAITRLTMVWLAIRNHRCKAQNLLKSSVSLSYNFTSAWCAH